MSELSNSQARSKDRIYYGWAIVLVSAVGLSTGPGQFVFSSLGLFIIPLGNEFGWDRAEVSLASTFFTITLGITVPFIGRLIDKFGSKTVLIPSIVFMALGLIAISLLISELWHLFLIFILIGLLSAGANSPPYMRVISTWFDRRRGLAIGIAMGGAGASFMYIPPLVQYMIDAYGWRSGYYSLAAITLLITLPLMLLFFRDPHNEDEILDFDEKPLEGADYSQTGMTISEALKTRVIWFLFLIFCLLSFCLYGLYFHLVPMLIDRGMSSTDAAWIASSIGVTVIIARIVIGFLIDRFFAPRIALVCFVLTIVGLALLANGAVYAMALLAAVFIGFSLGVEIDLLAYLTSRYFGLKSFGQIYGVLFTSFLLGASLGPVSFGLAFEMTGSYIWVLLLSIGLIVLASIVTALLPKYPKF